MRKNSIRYIIILGFITIAAIISIQIIWIKNAWNASEKQFNQSVHMALKNVANCIYDYNKIEPTAEYPVNQISSNYFIVNTNSEINTEILEYFLRSEFEMHNLKVDFEYGIYNCQDDRMIYGNYIHAGGKAVTKDHTNLPKFEGYTYYFGVHFPQKSAFIINQISVWIIFSSILLIVMIFLAYAMYIIFQQKRYSGQQRDFINNMTHEFKTPISSIYLSTQVLSKPQILNEPERLKNYVELIKSENNRLNQQVEKVLNISRIETKEFRLKHDNFDAHEVIGQIYESISSVNHSCKIRCYLNAENSKITADKLHFSNILYNLVDNAIKYSKENPEIDIRTATQNKTFLLSIKDNGIGMTKEQQKLAFKKFYRVPTGNIHDVKGFGLGLFYVKSICNLHKWKIKLKSEIEKGTEITIFINV